MSCFARISTLALASALATGAFAQATVKDDGQWRAALGAGAAFASGNTDSTTFNFAAEAIKATKQDKLRLFGNAAYARSGGVTTGDMYRLGTQYDYNLSSALFAFGTAELSHDKFSNLDQRLSLGAGLGYKVIKEAALTFDVFGGLNYTVDRYETSTLIDGSVRKSYNSLSAMFGEESTHKLSPTTSFKQRLVVFPSMSNTGEFRATFDAGLAVAMTAGMNLNVGLQHRYNSEPGTGIKKGDTLLTTGVTVKFE
jgi:putative salt-induced outer membrane protein